MNNPGQGNTLSPIMRQGWDGLDPRSMTKNSPARSTKPHISLIGHITADELRRYLTLTEIANGFGNRHLWIGAQRSKLLPEGGALDAEVWEALKCELSDAIAFAPGVGVVAREVEAKALWEEAGCCILMPEEPTETRKPIKNATMFLREANQVGFRYVVGYVDVPKLLTESDQDKQQRFNGIRDALVHDPGAKVVNERQLSLWEHAGRETVVDLGERQEFIRAQHFFVRDRCLFILYFGSKESVAFKETAPFFESFKLTK